jgi:hypothetical protein
MNTEDILAELKAIKTQKHKALIQATLKHIKNEQKAVEGLTRQRNTWKMNFRAMEIMFLRKNKELEALKAEVEIVKAQYQRRYLQ